MSEDYQEHHVSTRVHVPVLLIDEGIDSAPVGLNAPPPPKAAAHLDTVRQLRDLIRDVLPHERPTVERLARRLNMSVRTLQRRTRDVGLTFEALLDEARRQSALGLIESGENTVTETAYQLGYSDPAHFTRAFRRWTGIAPREFGRVCRQRRRSRAD